jgi:C4-dicarboxylate transporter, DctM subunit
MIDPIIVGLIGIALLLILINLNISVGAALLILGFAGFAYLGGMKAALANIVIIPFGRLTDYSFSTIPLFLLMGGFVAETGIGEDAFRVARAWLGQIEGGLAIATVAACGLFAATSGSSIACAVTMGKAAYPEMKRFKYDPRLALGCIAAGGTLGILIPPSIPFVLIGIITNLSIGKLFIAGIIPGILEVLIYCGVLFAVCKLRPAWGPVGPKTTFKQKTASLKYSWSTLLLFILVIGGIYGGIFTPSEAGGIGAFGAFMIALSSKRLTRANFIRSILDSGKSTAMLTLIMCGAFVFMSFLTKTRMAFVAADWVASLQMSRYFILAIVLVFYFVLGMIFDVTAVIVVTTPIIFPLILALGFDPIWYCVIMVIMIETGLITPPFGVNVFALSASSGESLTTIYGGVWPFVGANMLLVLILILFPQICLFLINTM